MKILETPWEQMKGLMFEKEKKKVLFKFKITERRTIHTWFMHYPVDIYFLNENRKVVEKKLGMVPWKLYKTKLPFKYMYEKGSE